MAHTPLKPAEDNLAAEPMRFGHEQHGFTFEERDPLLTIQGKVPKLITDSHKKKAQRVQHFNEFAIQTASLQAQYFLNAYWDKVSLNNCMQAERIYLEWVQWCELAKTKGENDPASFDGALSKVYLDRLKRTMTQEQFAQEFRAIDSNNDGRMAFLEYLLWDANKVWNPNGKQIIITPAHLTYRPQVFHTKDADNSKLTKAIGKVLTAQRARRENEDKFANFEKTIADMEAAGAGPAKLGKVKSDFDQFMANRKKDVTLLDGDIAKFNAKLLKAYGNCTEKGTEWWNARLQKEKDLHKPKSKKLNMRGFE